MAPEEAKRGKLHHDIAENTKPKRSAFLYVNKEYFLPLFPENSYVDKLQCTLEMSGESPEPLPYARLTVQPQGIAATMNPYELDVLSFLVYMHANGASRKSRTDADSRPSSLLPPIQLAGDDASTLGTASEAHTPVESEEPSDRKGKKPKRTLMIDLA